MDYREEITKKFSNKLTALGMPYEEIRDITTALTISLGDYDISPKCTELAVIDTDSERLVKLYLATIKTEGKRDRTIRAYADVLKRFIVEVNKPLVEVGAFDIRLWIATVQQKASMRTCENYRAYLSAFFRWMSREKLISENPMDRILPIKYEDEIKLPFSDVDIDKMRSACSYSKRSRAMLEVMLSSGVRVSELCAIELSDIDFHSAEVLIREGKGGKQRKTYIDSICLEYIKEYLTERKHNSDYLFVDRFGNQLTVNAVEQLMKRVQQKSGVENVHPHRFRRTFATKLSRKGMDIRTIQVLMGHSDINTTMGYISLCDEHISNEYRRYA